MVIVMEVMVTAMVLGIQCFSNDGDGDGDGNGDVMVITDAWYNDKGDVDACWCDTDTDGDG